MTHCFRWLLAVSLFALVIPAIPASAQPLQCGPIAGSLTARLGVDAEGVAWLGDAWLSINGGVPLHATLRDAADAPMMPLHAADPDSGDVAGEETLTFKLENGDSFKFKGYWIMLAGSGPYAGAFHETGKIIDGSGTGLFNRATGRMVLDGSVVTGGGMNPPQFDRYPFVWMAQIRGSVCLFPGAQNGRGVQP